MRPVRALMQQMMALLAADSTTLNPGGDGNHLVLIKNAFTPGPDLVIGALTFANFTGSGAKDVSNAPDISTDPANGDILITLTGGDPFYWETSDTVNLNQTIYGVALTEAGGTILYAADLLINMGFPAPVTLSDAGQSIMLGPVQFRLPVASMR